MEEETKTIRALYRSIEKWFEIVFYGGEDEGRRNCALCVEFFGKGCDGCPVNDVTGLSYCIGTPYSEWASHQEAFHKRYGAPHVKGDGCMVCFDLAFEELVFLVGLLDDEELIEYSDMIEMELGVAVERGLIDKAKAEAILIGNPVRKAEEKVG